MDSQSAVPDDSADRSSDDARSRLWDVGYESAGEVEYECLDCGLVVVADDHPLTCPTCDAALRNRSMPIE
ncbi:rubrerythrin-like domain-containing protein [Natrononativus amylolyticus]|uniref:rubrerythrin-like domain-containing protein n=1 Tax=Natrononativus amylolyticus TaxID=2963434 RepID=UPI0020CF3C69|nr:rubrerythrin-like domain-containing protein [Natrononativus amylolyticus]